MKTVLLKDICEIASGQSAPQDPNAFGLQGRPFIRAGSLEHLVNGGKEEDCELIPDEQANRLRLRLFPENTILFAKSGMSAKIGRVYRLKTSAYVVSHLAAIIPGPKIDASYLQRWFEKNPPSRLIPNEAYPSIRISEISNLRIKLPPLHEQKRIAAILDKADAIRRKRQQAIKLADEFLRAAFLDMFGDPATNPKGWKIGTIRELVSEAKYGTSKKASATSGKYPILRMNNITYNGEIDLSDLKYIDIDNKEKDKYLARKGDILFNRTNSKELVGKTAVFEHDTPMAVAGYIIRVRTNKKATPHYIAAYLNSKYGKALLSGMCKSIVGMANINAQELLDIKIPIPPIYIQEQFSEVVNEIQKRKKRLRDAASFGNALCNSLAQRAFRGEL